jgi:hypothetical protein
MQKLKHWINCHIWGWHDWTSKALRNEPMVFDPKKEMRDVVVDYARMYCAHCGKESTLNIKL